MLLQLEDPGNDGLFAHRSGTISRRVPRDVDGCIHSVFYDQELITHIEGGVGILLFDFTYKTCIEIPDENMQLGTVMAVYHDIALLIIWFLLSRKMTNALRMMATFIRQLLVNSNIVSTVTDFELALKNALQETFGRVYLIGCFFNYVRCLHGKIYRFNLSDFVRENDDS
ncbi:hypothetical protein TKK_0015449 [Trichogramma kaykai]|uniref:MULE transposase domain-containing protein n=1 Tax=Trichogramma kaykai TaxID=54128 RepID=A0ABD2WB10_9HYME